MLRWLEKDDIYDKVLIVYAGNKCSRERVKEYLVEEVGLRLSFERWYLCQKQCSQNVIKDHNDSFLFLKFYWYSFYLLFFKLC